MSISNYDAGSGYCPYCSNPPYSYMYHSGACPFVESVEYFPNRSLLRIEFNCPRTPSSVVYESPIGVNFGNPMDSPDYWKARIAVVEEELVLKPGRYIIIDGELFNLEDSIPPNLEVE